MVGAVVLVTAVLASLALGARSVDLSTVLDAVLRPDGAGGAEAVVRSRIPRTGAAILAGAALAVAGTAMQGLTRNPLADPGLLGVNAGAALAVVVAIAALGVTELSGYVWFAFLGAGLAAVVVYGIASLGREGATPVKLALAGAAVGAALSSLTQAVLIGRADVFDAFRFWQVGSVAGRGWDVLVEVLPFIVVGLLLTLALGPVLNGLALGEDVARGLGQRVALTRVVTAVGIVLLCGAATALAGPIAFVGLVVPHVVRGLAGPDYRWILPISLLVGPALVLAADVVGRLVLPPGEVEAGVMVALVGAPGFVWLVRRRRTVTL
nr:iron chelate uptake ABC transporter family permease subunit [Georgenia faecalis]